MDQRFHETNMIKALRLLVFVLALAGPVMPLSADDASPVANCSPDSLATSVHCKAPSSEGADLMIVRPGAGTGTRPPLLYIFGGPGLYPDIQFPRVQALANRWQRTLIVAVPPGLDETQDPRLRCTGDNAPRLWEASTAPENSHPMTSDPVPPIAACLAHLGDLSGMARQYTTATAVARLQAALTALQAGKIDILAESYGARIAYGLAEAAPGLVGSIVLDSPETPWVESFWHSGANLVASLDQLTHICLYTRKCPTQGRKTREKLLALLSGFDQTTAAPMLLRDQLTNVPLGYVRPARAHMELRILAALSSPIETGYLPFVAAASSDTDLQRRFSRLVSGYVLDDTPALSFAVHHMVRCSEWPMARWYKALEADAALYPALRPMLDYLEARQQHICRSIGITPPQSFAAPHFSQPTLVLSGTLDAVTPADSVAAAFAGAANVRHRLVQNAGHITQGTGACVLDDIDAFFRNPTAEKKSSCRKSDLKIQFFQPISLG